MSLEKIKDKLSECYKKNKPVLLYGDNSAGHIDLIHGIHIGNGGIRDAVEYVHVKEEPDRKVFLESIKKESSNALIETYAEVKEVFPRPDGIIDDDVYNSQFGMMTQAKLYSIKENLYCKIREAFKSTKKTWVYCNCDSNNGSSLCNDLSTTGDWPNLDEIDDPLKEGPLITSGRYLYDFKGTLFIDNLKCDSSNIRDVEHYWKFGMEISNKNISVNWLVAYISSLDDFPDNFLNQFEQISLDDCVDEVKQQKEKAVIAKVKNEESTSFPPSDTKWPDIEMFLMDEDHFRIKVKEKQKMVTFSEMGFKHKSSTKKSKLWSVLLRFAIANNSPIEYYANKSQVEKDIQRLNGVLINYFGINGNPVKYQNDKKGYVTEFKIYDRSHIKEHRNSIATTISDKETLDEEIDKDFHDSSL